MTRLIDLQNAYECEHGESVWNDSPRVRFNWGFDDGMEAEESQRKMLWSPKVIENAHPDPVYVAGHFAGRENFRRTGRRAPNSTAAWELALGKYDSDVRKRAHLFIVETRGEPGDLQLAGASIPGDELAQLLHYETVAVEAGIGSDGTSCMRLGRIWIRQPVIVSSVDVLGPWLLIPLTWEMIERKTHIGPPCKGARCKILKQETVKRMVVSNKNHVCLFVEAIPQPVQLRALLEPLLNEGRPLAEAGFDLVRSLDAQFIARDGAAPTGGDETTMFGHDLIRTLRDRFGRVPGDAVEREAVDQAADALRLFGLATRHVSDQYGYGNLLSSLRHAVLGREVEVPAGQTPAPAGRFAPFKASGLGAADSDLVVEWPPVGEKAHLGMARIYQNGHALPFLEVPVPEITGYTAATPALSVLQDLSVTGAVQVIFGDWYTADGTGRELGAAMVDGLVVRVGPATANGMGGFSPQFALTEAGRAWVATHTAPTHENEDEPASLRP